MTRTRSEAESSVANPHVKRVVVRVRHCRTSDEKMDGCHRQYGTRSEVVENFFEKYRIENRNRKLK
jgi:hypothetical protein